MERSILHSVKMLSQPFGCRANSLLEANRPIGPWPIRSLELLLLGPFALWPFRFLCHSLPGTFAPWNFRSREQNGLIICSREHLHSRVFAPTNIRFLELSFPVSPWHYLCHSLIFYNTFLWHSNVTFLLIRNSGFPPILESPCKYLNLFLLNSGLESTSKQDRCLKVLEFHSTGPWKSLHSPGQTVRYQQLR